METLVCLIVILPRSNSLQVVRVPNYPSIIVSELIGSVVVHGGLHYRYMKVNMHALFVLFFSFIIFFFISFVLL
jgi:hypothetical protein